MPKIPPPTGGDYPELPEKEWIEVSILSIEPFDDTKFPNRDGSPRARFEIVFEPTDPDLSASHIWAYAGRSWHEKSNLRAIAQATFSKDLPDEELFEVDTDDLKNKVLLVMGKYDTTKDPDKKFLKPTEYKRVAKGAKAAAKPAAKAEAKKAKEDDGDIDI